MTKTKGGCKTPPYFISTYVKCFIPDKYLILQKLHNLILSYTDLLQEPMPSRL